MKSCRDRWKCNSGGRTTGNYTVLSRPAPEYKAASYTRNLSERANSRGEQTLLEPPQSKPEPVDPRDAPALPSFRFRPFRLRLGGSTLSGGKGVDAARAAQAHCGGGNGATEHPEQVPAAHGSRAPGVPLAGECAQPSSNSDRRRWRGEGGVRGVGEPRTLSTQGFGVAGLLGGISRVPSPSPPGTGRSPAEVA